MRNNQHLGELEGLRRLSVVGPAMLQVQLRSLASRLQVALPQQFLIGNPVLGGLHDAVEWAPGHAPQLCLLCLRTRAPHRLVRMPQDPRGRCCSDCHRLLSGHVSPPVNYYAQPPPALPSVEELLADLVQQLAQWSTGEEPHTL
ncbi:hypothetical protein ABPG75_012850 [Micractinium tetrahymenae]